MPARKKVEERNHLSPSRRRALRPFFVQTRMYCTRACSPGGPWGSAGGRRFHRVQSFERKCSAVAQRCKGRSRRGDRWGTRFHWAKNFENVGFDGFSKTHTIFFRAETSWRWGRLISLQAATDGRCGVFEGFHRTEHDRRSFFPLCNRIRLRENPRLIGIDS